MNTKKHNVLSIVTELEAIRRAAGLRQEQLADAACVSRMTVSRVESGFDVHLSTFYELARALQMDLMLVPCGLRTEVKGFIQSGGKVLGQPPGVNAPLSVVDLLR